ncbi:hypothetical protein GOV06_05145 [Candidatus Woesearchaeota archaeon]|nr:hypothetical protein [Candidatus Woesearchaeota archaeon]
MKFDLSKIRLSKNDINKGLTLPKKSSKELAEFIGILAGDGHISFNTCQSKILITCNFLTEYDYLTYVKGLILKLFNINVKVRKRNNINAAIICFYSSALVSFMNQIGYYKHKINIIIPSWIKTNDTYMATFTRGLFDTDGCVFVSDKAGSPKYPCVELTTINLKLAEDIKKFLERKKFRTSKVRSYYYRHSNNASYKVSIYGWLNLSRWLKEIGFSNQYKLNKALRYRK